MKKNLIRLAIFTLTAGFCLSAQATTIVADSEIAMAKCSREVPADTQMDKNNKNEPKASKCRDSRCKERTTRDAKRGTAERQASNDELNSNRKSAAKKVVEGY